MFHSSKPWCHCVITLLTPLTHVIVKVMGYDRDVNSMSHTVLKMSLLACPALVRAESFIPREHLLFFHLKWFPWPWIPALLFIFTQIFFRMSHKALKTFANKIKCGENSLLREHEQFCGFACFLMSNLIVGSLFKLCKCITQPMNRWKMIKDVLIWFFLWRIMAVQPNDTWLQHHDDCLQILLRLILCRDPFL